MSLGRRGEGGGLEMGEDVEGQSIRPNEFPSPKRSVRSFAVVADEMTVKGPTTV